MTQPKYMVRSFLPDTMDLRYNECFVVIERRYKGK